MLNGAAKPMKWLTSAAPIAKTVNNPRHLPPRLLQAREIALANPPAEVSSKDLPSNVRFHIKTELIKHDLWHRKPWLDPRIAQNGQYRQGVKGQPERLFDENNNELVPINNPFLVRPYPMESYTPTSTRKIDFMHRQPINKREQVRLAAKYPPHLLPPSSTNPLRNPPRIRWDEPMFKGKVITWLGHWEPKERKGIYHNRGQIFKGTRKEREKEGRTAEIADRVAGMDERIAKWKEQKRQAKIAERPQIPF